MNYIGKFITNFKDFYREINSATLTGAIDVVIIRQADGTYLCSPFHVRFGKIDVLRSKEKIVDIEINDEPVEIFMKLGDNGEAFFIEEWTEDNENSNSTTRVMCKKKEVEKMKLDENIDEDENNLTEFNLYENGDYQPEEQLDSIEEGDETNLNEQLDDFKFSNSNPSITRTKSIPISTINHEIHPYSDGECTPFVNNSPTLNEFDRPLSPKSDTEYEITRNDCKKVDVEEEFSWQWGELPQVSRKVSAASRTSDQVLNLKNEFNKINVNSVVNIETPDIIKEEVNNKNEIQSSNTTGLLNNDLTLLNKDKKVLKSLKEKGFKEEGIYLDEINLENLDPEVLDLYFLKLNSTDHNEAESEKDLSLPSSSPQIENNLTSGSDLDEKVLKSLKEKGFKEEGIYLDEINPENLDPEVADLYFPNLRSTVPLKKVSDDDEAESGKGLSLPSNSPQRENSLTSGSDLDEKEDLMNIENSKLVENNNLTNIELNSQFKEEKLEEQLEADKQKEELPNNQVNKLIEQQKLLNLKKKETGRSSWWSWRTSYSEQKLPQPKIAEANDALSLSLSNKDKFKKSVDLDGSDTDSEDSNENLNNKNSNSKKYHKKNYKRVLRLGSKDIENLNLREGANEVQFSVTTAYQGTSRCKCHVYLWNHDDKIIVSDIDGTITKSDVLGHILPRIGHLWVQAGVANLFTKIKENGYKMLYLSARAIGQAENTREYLKSVKQGELCLPEGPLLLSPTSLLSAFHREVIEKKPEEFKISCLKDIQALFPFNPFYAGFGNKINDTWAYRAVGIPLYRIFTINHKGELRLELIQTFQSSYTKLTSVVDHMFPPLENKREAECFADYTSFNYWRDVLPEINEEIEKEKKQEEEEKALKSKQKASTSPKNSAKKSPL